MPSVKTGGFRIMKNRKALPTSVAAAIRSVRVENEINVPTMFSFTLNTVSAAGRWQDIDLDMFQPGDAITVSLGIDTVKQLVDGQITAIEPHFSAYSTATIRGFDRMYWLKFGTRTRTFQKLSDNDIVAQVADETGLKVRLSGNTGVINDYVLQNNLTNYDFLMLRCSQLDYELMMSESTLVFRPCAEGSSPVRTLNYPVDVSDLQLNLRVPTLGKKVTVTGYDVASNRVLTAVTASATNQQKMGGKAAGYQLAEDFPSSQVSYERPNIGTQQALEKVSAAQYQRNLNQFIEGSSSVLGDPDLVAGVNVRISGLSERFNGIYYVTSSVHTFDVDEGYQTEFKLRRTGI